MSTVFIGWDVGAWGGNFEAKTKNDCISILIGDDIFIGSCQSFSDNIFKSKDIDGFFKDIIDKSFNENEAAFLKYKLEKANSVVVAVDAVLSLPEGISDLYNLDLKIEKKDFQRFLFREIEKKIVEIFSKRKNWPKKSCLSLMRDSIGSHSVKTLTFLNKFQFKSLGMNVFQNKRYEKYFVFETYPGFYIKHEDKHGILKYYDVKQSKMMSLKTSHLKVRRNKDKIDSVICCLIAKEIKCFSGSISNDMKRCFFSSNKNIDGFIWLPRQLNLHLIGSIRKGQAPKNSN